METLTPGGADVLDVRAVLRAALLQEGFGLDGDHVERTRAAGPFRAAYLPLGTAQAPLHGVIGFPLSDPERHVVALRVTVGVQGPDGAHAVGSVTGDGELEDLAWRPVSALSGLDIVDVTEYVLKEALRRWQARAPAGAEPPKLLNYRKDIMTLSRHRTRA